MRTALETLKGPCRRNLAFQFAVAFAALGASWATKWARPSAMRPKFISSPSIPTYGFDPESDGAVVYSRTALFDLDLDPAKTGSIWHQRATSVDHIGFLQDPHANSAMTVCLRHLQGRRLLYGIGQYGGGSRLFTFDEPSGDLARPPATSPHRAKPGLGTWRRIATSGTGMRQEERSGAFVSTVGPPTTGRNTTRTGLRAGRGRTISTSCGGSSTIRAVTRSI